MWDLGSPSRDPTCCFARQILSHCTTREVRKELLKFREQEEEEWEESGAGSGGWEMRWRAGKGLPGCGFTLRALGDLFGSFSHGSP